VRLYPLVNTMIDALKQQLAA
jgi:hypothetical protein